MTKRYKYHVLNKIKNGVEEDFYDNGQLRLRREFKDGKLNGVYESFHENGVLRYKSLYKDNRQVGVGETFYPTGELEHRTTIDRVKKQYLRESFTKKDGVLVWRENYTYKHLDPDKPMTMMNIKLHGLKEDYSPNTGMLLIRGNYKEGVRHGLFKQFDEEGNLITKECYKNGECVDMSYCED